jgi:hypothetical protein
VSETDSDLHVVCGVNTEALLKLYSRELSSTIDLYKNTKIEYIYSKQFALLATRG